MLRSNRCIDKAMKTRCLPMCIFAVFPLLAAGCGPPTSDSSVPISAPPPTLSSVTADKLLEAIRTSNSPAVLVNMWATWCVPCIEEMPDLLRLQQNYRERGVKLFLVSWDTDAKLAQQFLRSKKVDFPSFIKDSGQNDPGFIDGLTDKWSGALPATFLFDGNGKLVQMWEGKQPYEVFEKKLLELLKPSADNAVQQPKGVTP
jgi:thiol-disulfide isomerase/thioredoxin